MKKFLILLVVLIITLTVFADGGDDPKDQTDSTLPPVSGEITVEASSTSNMWIKEGRKWREETKQEMTSFLIVVKNMSIAMFQNCMG